MLRKILASGSGCIAALFAGAAFAADPMNMAGADTPEAKVAMAWVNLAFNEHQMGEAFDKYVSRDNYMNHASGASSKDKQTFAFEKAYEIRFFPPASRFEIKQVFAQGEYVVLQIHAFHGPEDRLGDELVEFLRVQRGKIVDHWDLHIPVREDSLVFAGLDRHTDAEH